MRRLVPFLLAAATLFAADSPWTKVQELKHGADLRVYKKGAKEPLVVKFDEANEERILVVSKTAQLSVAREDIDRIDARPPEQKSASKPTTTTTGKTVDPDYTPHPPGGVPVPTTSYGSSVAWGSGSKGEFVTVYKRP